MMLALAPLYCLRVPFGTSMPQSCLISIRRGLNART